MDFTVHNPDHIGMTNANTAPSLDSVEYWTTPETAAHYRQPESTIRYWRMIGYGPRGVRAGRRVLYPVAEIERFDRELAEQATSASRPA
jgi:hypothetical protein